MPTVTYGSTFEEDFTHDNYVTCFDN